MTGSIKYVYHAIVTFCRLNQSVTMNPDDRDEKRRPSGGKQHPGHAPYSRVNQSEDRVSEKQQITPSPKNQSDHGPYSIHQSDSFPPEPGCDMSNPYYDLAVPSSSSSSYTVDSHWELLKVCHHCRIQKMIYDVLLLRLTTRGTVSRH